MLNCGGMKLKKTTREIFEEKMGIYEDENDLLHEDIEESGEVTLKDLEGEIDGK